MVAYTAAGAHRWSHAHGGLSHDRANGIAADAQGGVAMVGDFQGSVTFGGLGARSSNGARDVMVVRYDAGGALQWVHTYGAAREDIAWSAATRNGLLTVSGTFRETIDFGGGALTSAGELDLFLTRWAF